jgi:hypothetical protein
MDTPAAQMKQPAVVSGFSVGGAVRDASENKSRVDLISPFAIERLGFHLAKGAKAYSPRNWEKGMPISRCVASLERHVMQYKMGLTNEDHMAAVMCNAMFILHYEEGIRRGFLPKDLDDMPHYVTTGAELPTSSVSEAKPGNAYTVTVPQSLGKGVRRAVVYVLLSLARRLLKGFAGL